MNNHFVPEILNHLTTQSEMVRGLKEARDAAQSEVDRIASERDHQKLELDSYRSKSVEEVENLQHDIAKLKNEKESTEKEKQACEAKLKFVISQLEELGVQISYSSDAHFFNCIKDSLKDLQTELQTSKEAYDKISHMEKEKSSLKERLSFILQELNSAGWFKGAQSSQESASFNEIIRSETGRLQQHLREFSTTKEELKTREDEKRSQEEKFRHLLTMLQDIGYCIGISTDTPDFYDDARQSIQALDENVKNTQSSYERLLRQYEDVSSQLSKAVAMKEKEEGEKWKYLKECEELRPYKTKLNSLAEKLHYVLNLGKIDIDEEPSTFNEQLHERVVSLRDEISSTETSKHWLSKRVENLESQLDNVERDKHTAERSVQSFEQDYNALKREKDKLERQQEERRSELQGNISSLERKLEERSESVSELQADLGNAKMELSEYKSNCQILELEVEKLRSGIQSVRKSNIKLSQQLSSARKQLYESKITNIRDQFDSIGSWVDTASASNDDSKAFGRRTTAAVRSTESIGGHDSNHFSPPWSADALMNKNRNRGSDFGERGIGSHGQFDDFGGEEGGYHYTGRLHPAELE
eukprot:gb/GECG01004638.1/.p1 GENE.gb/GECG01004638.1/~~gb/GECG01004638.1/.p1  ORF type:complete len:587 (+),score=119.39 gb/GECG01004638.1/:1-1761(+)